MPLDPGEQFMQAPDPNQKTDPAVKDFFQGIGQALFGWGKNNPQASGGASTPTDAKAAAPTSATPAANPQQNNSGPIDQNGNPPAGAPLSATGSTLDSKMPDTTFSVPIPDLSATNAPGDAQAGGNKDGSYGGGLGKMIMKLFAL